MVLLLYFGWVMSSSYRAISLRKSSFKHGQQREDTTSSSSWRGELSYYNDTRSLPATRYEANCNSNGTPLPPPPSMVNYGVTSIVTSKSTKSVDIALASGKLLQVWIEYDGVTTRLDITMSVVGVPRPHVPLVYCEVKVSSTMPLPRPSGDRQRWRRISAQDCGSGGGDARQGRGRSSR
jgi:hypothetical protein